MTPCVAVVVGATSAIACSADDPGATLTVVQDVPADVSAEIDVTWGRFVDRFAERLACIGDVSLVLVRDIDGGDARYVADHTRIEIRIPTTPARFRESLAHELAHHVERTCADFIELQAVLHPMLGGPLRPWADGEVWAEIPAEVWAEGVVEVTNGERIRHVDEMPIDDDIIDLILAWAGGIAPIRTE